MQMCSFILMYLAGCPMPLITLPLNKNLVPDEFVDASPRLTTLMLGLAGGSEKLYSNIDLVEPGSQSCKFHSHSLQEEFFIVLSGRGVLRLADKSYEVCAGSCFSKPAGKGIAHQFINNSDQTLEILDVGIPHPEDIIEYPDEHVIYRKAERQAYRKEEPLSDWTSDPNV